MLSTAYRLPFTAYVFWWIRRFVKWSNSQFVEGVEVVRSWDRSARFRISDITHLPSASLGEDAKLTLIVIDSGAKNCPLSWQDTYSGDSYFQDPVRQHAPTTRHQLPGVQRNLVGSSGSNSQTIPLHTIPLLPLSSIRRCTPDILAAVCLCPCHASQWGCLHNGEYPSTL